MFVRSPSGSNSRVNANTTLTNTHYIKKFKIKKLVFEHNLASSKHIVLNFSFFVYSYGSMCFSYKKNMSASKNKLIRTKTRLGKLFFCWRKIFYFSFLCGYIIFLNFFKCLTWRKTCLRSVSDRVWVFRQIWVICHTIVFWL